jgi:hypothetical protein
MTDWELKQHRANRENEQKGREVAQDLMKLLNMMGGNKAAEKALIEGITTDHRTLQQAAGGLVIKLIKEWSDQESKGYYDGRNEALVKFCSKLVNHPDFKDVFEYGFPFI